MINLFNSKEEFFSFFLNEEWSISKKFLDDKSWNAIPVPNTLTLIESEWLSNSIHSLGFDHYIEFTFEYEGDIYQRKIANNQENIFYSDFNNLQSYIIITNENLDFIYFRNQNNLYHLFCGKYDFIYNCVKCSNRMAKEIFFSYGVYDYNEQNDEHYYLKKIWEYYKS
ncbi:TPA: hypothetical protein ACFP4Q_002126 [Neisseria weaveri]|uniref:Uncharacterized protein n=1 Tax=Neisseria weaveri TaxID=28091 RepID=A0A3S5A6M4_9NEIS|nr:hypothetical protein [Neisseria weaveri]SAY50793.1 Uncharacterised protein [Neisseria weaveri]VEJ49083.1 Uncharacterised protein [Neisseria weaveri]